MPASPDQSERLQRTALHGMHIAAGARMVPFAGFEMALQYRGIKAEHLHTREAAGLFDVSHMGQILVRGECVAAQLEKLLPLNLDAMTEGQQKYCFFTMPGGGMLDDLIISKRDEQAFFLVVNAARKQEDLAHLQQHLPGASVTLLEQQALLALQGPRAERALRAAFPQLGDALNNLAFMQSTGAVVELDGAEVAIAICRSGYTGEDGFEVSIENTGAEQFATKLLEQEGVEWIGLGARDSLRLEAGLCLYGHDIDETTSPVEAGLSWCIDRDRRSGGSKEGGFEGSEVILAQLDKGVSKRRTGFFVDARIPAREGAEIVSEDGTSCGVVTSGGFAPSLNRPIAMAYIKSAALEAEQPLYALVRDRKLPLSRTPLPFIRRRD